MRLQQEINGYAILQHTLEEPGGVSIAFANNNNPHITLKQAGKLSAATGSSKFFNIQAVYYLVINL
jgi:2'-5' RNA ligase